MNDIAENEQEALLLELFDAMSEEDQAAMLKATWWLAARPKDELLTFQQFQEVFESARRIQ